MRSRQRARQSKSSVTSARVHCWFRNDAFAREKQLLLDENAKERELHSVLREKFNDMTKKFDV